MASQCLGTNRDGGPCSAWVPSGRDHCQWHDPDREAERRQWRARGGQNRSNRHRAKKQVFAAGLSLDEVDGALSAALARVLTGRMEPNVGTAASTIARAIIAVRQVSDLDARLTALEAATKGKAS